MALLPSPQPRTPTSSLGCVERVQHGHDRVNRAGALQGIRPHPRQAGDLNHGRVDTARRGFDGRAAGYRRRPDFQSPWPSCRTRSPAHPPRPPADEPEDLEGTRCDEVRFDLEVWCALTGHGGIGNRIVFPVSGLNQRIGSRALVAPASDLICQERVLSGQTIGAKLRPAAAPVFGQQSSRLCQSN
jgi:hypothetical protein